MANEETSVIFNYSMKSFFPRTKWVRTWKWSIKLWPLFSFCELSSPLLQQSLKVWQTEAIILPNTFSLKGTLPYWVRKMRKKIRLTVCLAHWMTQFVAHAHLFRRRTVWLIQVPGRAFNLTHSHFSLQIHMLNVCVTHFPHGLLLCGGLVN